MKSIIKIILLQLFWYLAVKSGPNNHSVFIWVVSIGLIFLNFYLFQLHLKVALIKYIQLAALFFSIGFIHYFILIYFKLLESRDLVSSLFWLNTLWIIFFCYLDSIEYLKRLSFKILATMSFFGATFSYFSGVKLSGQLINQEILFCFLVGGMWAIFFPVYIRFFYSHLKG